MSIPWKALAFKLGRFLIKVAGEEIVKEVERTRDDPPPVTRIPPQ